MKIRSTPTRDIVCAGFGACLMVATSASADQVFADDIIVQGSACVGTDCSNGENFGFDTLRLKENNLRLKFQDTSNSASFPTRDWTIVANDSGNGGANYLAFEDVDAGRIPFKVEAGAPNNSLFVDSTGRIGIKTGTPVVDIHVVNGNSPSLRLEQDGSSGFSPQTWDLAGNETNFFIRDVTNSSRLPFKIKPGAPTDSLFIAADGDIGLGTTTPDYPLDVSGSGIFQGTDGFTALYVTEASTTDTARELLKLTNNGGVGIALEDSGPDGDKWTIVGSGTVDSRLIINANGASREFQLDEDGNLIISGTITTSGSCSSACDGVFAPEYDVLPISARAEMMYDLGYLPNVGPTAEAGQYDLTQKLLGMLNELEHAHIYISQLDKEMKVLEAKLTSLESER